MTGHRRMQTNTAVRSKRRAITNEEEAGEDIISTFPESLLIHILSFLGDTKEIVQTCVLSKRWEFVWTHLLEINWRELSSYDGENGDDDRLIKFVDFVRRMTDMCKNLKRLDIGFQYHKYFVSDVNHWVSSAITKHEVKDITLEFFNNDDDDDMDRYDLPQMLFSYSSLSNLSVSNCVINPQESIKWKSLESLTIESAELLDSLMENILSNCPILSSLHLYSCWGLNYLNIKSPKLTTLDYGHWGRHWEVDQNLPRLDITAPNLRVLSIFSPAQGRQYKLTNVSSVVQAKIEFRTLYSYDWSASDVGRMNLMNELLVSLCSVEKLELGPRVFEIVSLLEVKSWKLPSYTNLRSLKLKVFDDEMSILGILAILRSSSNITTLLIEGCGSGITNRRKKKDLDQHEIRRRVKDYDMDFVASHLKTVEIDKTIKVEHMLSLVQILLKLASVLEKMVISFDAPSSSASVDSTEIAKRLHTFPKASNKAAVVLR